MDQPTLEAQGTKLRIAAALAVAATITVTSGIATADSAAHGLAVGDRIHVGTKGVTVATAPDADTFTYADADAVAGAISYKPYETIAAKTYNGPGGSAAVIDATNLLSAGKEKRMGLGDSGQMTLTVNFSPEAIAQTMLRAAKASRAKTPFEMEFSDGTIWGYDGFVLSFVVTGSVDALVEASVAIEITNVITEYA